MSDHPPSARMRQALQTHDEQDDLLLTREVAEMLRTPESTVRCWRHVRTGPPSFEVGRRVLCRRQAVIAWLNDRESEAPEAVAPGGLAGDPVTVAAALSQRGRRAEVVVTQRHECCTSASRCFNGR